MQLLKQIFWPPVSPPALSIRDPNDRLWWALTCVLLVLPLAAIAHNSVFYPSRCMLDPFGADYSSLEVLSAWLSRDPSLPWSIAMALATFLLGRQVPLIKILAACLLISFMPLAIWIWDIPFTGRVICFLAHDDRLQVLGWPVRTRYFYFLGIVLFVGVLIMTLRKPAFRAVSWSQLVNQELFRWALFGSKRRDVNKP
jgi:hypothetical protein